MFHGTYDRAARADRYRKVAGNILSCRTGLPIHTSAPITFASPKIIKTSPSANCGRWSERGSARRPVTRAHQRKLREDSDHPRKEKPGAAHLQPAYRPVDETCLPRSRNIPRSARVAHCQCVLSPGLGHR